MKPTTRLSNKGSRLAPNIPRLHRPSFRAGLAALEGLRLGQVATRTSTSDSINATYTQVFSRTLHTATDNILSLQAEFANWYVESGIEKLPGAAATIYAAIEYPIGSVPIRLPFGGLAQGTIPDGGNLLSDAVFVGIPKGAQFAIKSLYSNPNGILAALVNRSTANDKRNLGTGALVDQTTTTTDPATGSTSIYAPTAIVAMTSALSLFIAGDSRARGSNDGAAEPLKGEIERSISPALGFINAARSAESLASVIAAGAYTRRLALSGYCSHVICNHGINDVSSNTTGPTMITRLATFAAMFGGKPFYQLTIAPRSTSTDAWATAVNQTTHANNAARVAYNDAIRAGIAGVTGYFEVADLMETARNSGIWKSPGFTDDGTHETAAGHAAIAASGVINPAAFI